MSDAMASDRVSARGWTATLTGVCIAQAVAIAGFDFTLPFIPLYLQHDLGIHGLGQTALWAGLIGFGPAIPATICGPFWGRLADKIGYRYMLLRAMWCAALLITVMGFAPNPFVLFGLRMLQGALTGTVFSSQALVAASVPKSETARSMGLLQMSVYVGATFGPIGGGAIADALGYRAAFVSAGMLLALATLVVVGFVREPEQRQKQREQSSGDRSKAPSLLSVLSIPAFLAALALTCVVQFASTALFPVIPLYVQDLLHTAHGVAADTGWVFALSGVAAAIGSYGAGRLHRYFGLKWLLWTSLVLSALLLIPQAFIGSYTAFLLFRCLSACAFGALFGLVGTLAATSSPDRAKGTAFGLIGAASSLGFGSGPLLGGALVAALGIRPLFVLSAGLLLTLPVCALAIPTVIPRLSRTVMATMYARGPKHNQRQEETT